MPKVKLFPLPKDDVFEFLDLLAAKRGLRGMYTADQDLVPALCTDPDQAAAYLVCWMNRQGQKKAA